MNIPEKKSNHGNLGKWESSVVWKSGVAFMESKIPYGIRTIVGFAGFSNISLQSRFFPGRIAIFCGARFILSIIVEFVLLRCGRQLYFNIYNNLTGQPLVKFYPLITHTNRQNQLYKHLCHFYIPVFSFTVFIVFFQLVAVIDYQLLHVGNFAEDIARILMLTMTRQQRRKHTDMLVSWNFQHS